jgi:hypothetical protein
MAKAPQKKQGKQVTLTAYEKQIIEDNIFRGNKSYKDLLAYAQQFNELNSTKASEARFPAPLSISAQEAFSPYYGSDYERQQAAAAEYARQLAVAEAQANSKPLVQIDPKYYEELQRKVPVRTAEVSPHYNATRDQLVLPTPVELADRHLSYTDQTLAMNNFGSRQDLAKTFKEKLGNYYRDIAEHEAGHIADKYVQFAKTDLGSPDQRYNFPKFDYGYMGKEDHLVTGLGKVQRELYAKTGARIESPDQFKQFVLDLAKAENTEEAISGFSEEAKRSLRPQIKNAKEVQDYYNQLDISKKSWFKISPAIPRKQLDFLEKSAQLMPALVQTGTRNKSSV